jgi:beta-mannosidase
VYPPDAFFRECDRLGILVWQDLMFANTMVPDDDAFVNNVREEVEQQVRRLQYHPCLALWCGNNEVDVAWHNWGWQRGYDMSPADSIRMWTAYTSLFQGAFREWIWTLDKRGAYTSTSPLSNWGNAQGLRNGDLHYWGVWHADSTFNSFKGNTGRFVSEYGFQSYPDSASLADHIDPRELKLGSPVLEYRQRSYRTDRPIIAAIEREIGSVPRTLHEFCRSSQRVQAIAYEKAIAAHMGASPHCMGTLLWQLNDVWPGPSWSIIGYDGEHKLAYDAVRKAYAAGAQR